MTVEPNVFQIILVLLVVAYKAWEFLRNSARKKSETAQNVPVPSDLDDMPWEESAPPARQERDRMASRTFTPPVDPELFSQPPPPVRPRPASIGPSKHTTRTAPIREAGKRAQATPALRDLILGQVILGKPVALSRGRNPFSVRR